MLMEDFELSPEITHNCANEIKTHCGNQLSKQGETLHCLMGLAHAPADDNQPTEDSLLGDKCDAAVSLLSCL